MCPQRNSLENVGTSTNTTIDKHLDFTVESSSLQGRDTFHLLQERGLNSEREVCVCVCVVCNYQHIQSGSSCIQLARTMIAYHNCVNSSTSSHYRIITTPDAL
jgi:hypothetical protein